jgi:hypothetical protein
LRAILHRRQEYSRELLVGGSKNAVGPIWKFDAAVLGEVSKEVL